MDKVFKEQCKFLEESTDLDMDLCIKLMSAAHQDKKSLHDFIRGMGRYSEGRRRWLFKLVSATKHGFNIFAGKELSA